VRFLSSAFALPAFAETPAASFERPVDLVHLARQTLGDRALEREVLGLFQVQARAIFAQLQSVTQPKARLDLAHTLKGSARAVGAWKVAEAAEFCETLGEDSSGWQHGLAQLQSCIGVALAAIEEINHGA
jgi:HPt (histidine-containing phosphotransfer) domain-containing protein